MRFVIAAHQCFKNTQANSLTDHHVWEEFKCINFVNFTVAGELQYMTTV